MGSGDWNDGMDKIGAGGKGESVWLGWFLCSSLNAFANIAERRGCRRSRIAIGDSMSIVDQTGPGT